MTEENQQPEQENLQNFDGDAPGAGGGGATLDLIKEVPVTLSVEIGRAKINIRELLDLNHGSIVKLQRLVGEPLDVNVNGILVARGDVVVVEDKLGVRLTEVISPEQRADALS